MTDRISTDDLRKLLAEATQGPWVFDGDRVKASDRTVSDLRYKNGKNDGRLIAAVRDLAAEVIRLREALEPFAEAADGRKSKNISGSHCFGQAHLLKARAELNHKETDNGAS